jgi:hypothetical protein
VEIQSFVGCPANLLTFEESSKSSLRALLIREEVALFKKCFHLEKDLQDKMTMMVRVKQVTNTSQRADAP